MGFANEKDPIVIDKKTLSIPFMGLSIKEKFEKFLKFVLSIPFMGFI